MKTVWALLTGAMLLVSTQALAQPDHAANIVIKHLGKKFDPQSRRMLDGYAIIDYKKGHAKPDHAGGPKNNGGGSCFTALAKGATWAASEPYGIDLTGSGLSDAALTIFTEAAEKWNDHTSYPVFGAFDDLQAVNSASIGVSINGENEVDFGLLDPGVIAVTYVWGIFSGPPPGRVLEEWDMRFNTAFVWSAGDPVIAGAMDFENITQHELGHALGLGHPDSSCTEETMYAYAAAEETIKRDLHDGDIAGAMDLY